MVFAPVRPSVKSTVPTSDGVTGATFGKTYGAKTRLADVAEQLGVTRQTVYFYFAGSRNCSWPPRSMPSVASWTGSPRTSPP
ncbi:TetR family transcriptional regulator [Actinomadura fibrosa]|uniref:TetR family transcriptional regulator n=1 Tax=Actinomadura fibrosa TaxID=111802 RepID=A0ABW2XM55_9ACTN|nr:TetR family transcriptional regulator [Actinomadura fibrosa]